MPDYERTLTLERVKKQQLPALLLESAEMIERLLPFCYPEDGEDWSVAAGLLVARLKRAAEEIR